MTLHTLLLFGATFFFLLSALHYFANDLMTAQRIAQSRFLLAHPWILNCSTLLLSLGMIAFGLINMVTTPEKWQYLPNILMGLYLLVRRKTFVAIMLQRLDEEVKNPDSIRRLYEKAAKGFFVAAVLLLLASFAAGNADATFYEPASESSWAW